VGHGTRVRHGRAGAARARRWAGFSWRAEREAAAHLEKEKLFLFYFPNNNAQHEF
jgi:hypothetical protein